MHSEDDQELGSPEKKKKSRKSKKVEEMVEDLQRKFMGKEDSNDGSSVDSEDADLFSVPMNQEAFMAKIQER